ncbi:MAG: outer membrane protein assembly factor BamD [Alphaproteobacteria bacterium]|nr:outer membrane protein assembly factor BamD [Alphaproteobacteria bacterium]
MTIPYVSIRTALRAGRAAALGAACVLALVACGSKDDDNKNYVERPVEQLYNTALDALGTSSYVTAAKAFEEVDRQHPYSVWATKAQVMAAFSYYQANKYDEAILALDRFIQLHPGHRDVAYAYYLKALCYYEQIADVGRDQRITEQALNALADVVKRFPETGYARDARLKVDLAIDHRGGKEMDVGRFYQKQRQYVAAINRYRQVIEKYQTTTHTPEALHRLVECYLALGVQQEAKMAAAVLGHNYPGSDWYADSYLLLEGVDLRPERTERSWLTRIWKSIF